MFFYFSLKSANCILKSIVYEFPDEFFFSVGTKTQKKKLYQLLPPLRFLIFTKNNLSVNFIDLLIVYLKCHLFFQTVAT